MCVAFFNSRLSAQATEVISNLHAAHQSGNKNSGFDIRGEGSSVTDAVSAGILDLYLCKYWGIKLASNAAATALKIDEVSSQLVGVKPHSIHRSTSGFSILLPATQMNTK